MGWYLVLEAAAVDGEQTEVVTHVVKTGVTALDNTTSAEGKVGTKEVVVAAKFISPSDLSTFEDIAMELIEKLVTDLVAGCAVVVAVVEVEVCCSSEK